LIEKMLAIKTLFPIMKFNLSMRDLLVLKAESQEKEDQELKEPPEVEEEVKEVDSEEVSAVDSEEAVEVSEEKEEKVDKESKEQIDIMVETERTEKPMTDLQEDIIMTDMEEKEDLHLKQ
jgi:hypothetical protein